MKKVICTLLIAIFCMGLFAEEKGKNPTVIIKTNHGNIIAELFPEIAPKTVQNFIDLAEGKKEFTNPKTNEKMTAPFYDGLKFHRVMKNFMIQGGCPLGDGMGGPGYKFEDEINADSLGLDKEKFLNEAGQLNEKLRIYPQQQLQQMLAQPVFAKLGINSQETFVAKQKEFQEEMNKTVQAMTVKKFYESIGYKYDDKLKSLPVKKGFLAMANAGPNTNGSQFFINVRDNLYLDGKHTVFGEVKEGFDIVEKISLLPTNSEDAPKEPVIIESIRLVKESDKVSPKK